MDETENLVKVCGDFGWALDAMRARYRVCRKGWNAKRMWVALRYDRGIGSMTPPYLYIRTPDGHFVPWTPSQTDLLSKDWTLYDEG